MMEIIETYNCEEHGCGRKFETKERLLDHYKRRHERLYRRYNNNQIENEQRSRHLLDELYDKINDIENNADNLIDYEDIEREVERNIKFNENINFDKDDSHSVFSKTSSVNMSSSVNVNKVTVITDEMLGIGSKYADYDEIDEIDLQDRNIYCFRTKTNVNFTYLLYVTSINLSNNFIKDISHIKHFTTVKFLNISHNRIDDISELEHLDYLEALDAENNEINSISTLTRCKNLRILKLANNKIKYESSTYKTLQNLSKLKELTIKNNPFLLELFGYKHFFICKYPKLSKLEDEDIAELDREVALKFIQEQEKNDMIISQEDNNRVTRLNSTQTQVNDKIITKIEYTASNNNESGKKLHSLKIIKKGVRTNSLGKDDEKLNAFKMGNPVGSLQRELEELRNENKFLADKNKSNELEIQSLKLELENSLSLIREYEKLLEENKINILTKEDEEKRKLRDEVELWKREYCDLLDKSMSTNVSTSRILTGSSEGKFRPQTAQVRNKKDFSNFDLYHPYDKTLDELSNFKNDSLKIKRKNSLDDSLNKSDSEEDNNNEEDNEIDELLRKSVTNLSSLKSEIKILSKASDSNRNNSVNKTEQVRNNRSLSKPKIIKDSIDVKKKLFNNLNIKK